MALSETAQLQIRISAQNAAGAVLGQVGQQFGQLQSTVMKVGAAIAGAFAIRDVLDSTQRLTHDLDALADSMGLSGDQASKWNYQARYVGITADDLSSSFQILANRVFSQADAIAKGTDDFTKLGVSVLTTTGQLKPMDDLLESVRQRMRQLDAPSQAVLERQLFGRSGGRLHDFLMLTAADVKGLTADLDAMGMTLGSDVVGAMEQQQREMNRLGFIFDSIKVKLGQALIPLFLRFAEAITRPTGPIKVFLDVMTKVLNVFKSVADRIGTFLEEAKARGVAAALSGLFDDIVQGVKGLLPRIGAELDTMGPVGFALKLLALSAAMSLASGVAGMVFGGLLSALQLGGGLLGWSAGGGANALMATAGVGLALVVASAVLTPQGSAMVGESGFVSMVAALFGGIAGVQVARGLGASTPISLAVGAGLVLGIASGTVITKSMTAEGSPLRDPNFWLGVLGLAGIATVAALTLGVGAGGALLIGLSAILAVSMVTAVTNQPGGPSAIRPEDRPSGAGLTTAVDVVNMYQSLLGRMPEDTGAIIGRIGLAYQTVYSEIYNSIESMAYRAKPPANGIYPGEARASAKGSAAGGAGIGGVPEYFTSAAYAASLAASLLRPENAAYGARFEMAEGGVIMPRPGGTLVRAAERGVPEIFAPLDRVGGIGGQNISVTVNGNVDSRERVRELAREVGAEILRATRGARNFSIA